MKHLNIIFLLWIFLSLHAVYAQNTTDVVIVNPAGAYGEHENSVFISPLDKNKILVSNNKSTGGVDVFTSTNGGFNWSNPTNMNDCDPAVMIDKNGDYYAGSACGGSFIIAKSTDSGVNWTTNAYTITSSSSDKDHIWTDNKKYKSNGTSNSLWGGLYAAYTPWGGGTIYFSYYNSSIPGFTTPQLISAGSNNLGVNIQTGPNGEVYACWAMSPGAGQPPMTNIGFNVSTDGGATWSDPNGYKTGIFTSGNLSGFPSKSPTAALCGGANKDMAVNSFPSMTVNQQNGYIFITWVNYSGDCGAGCDGCNAACGTCTNFPAGCNCDPDIYIIKSTDGGATWNTSSPIRVNAHANTYEQWHPWIACDEASGALVCTYYDSRTNNAEANTYVSISYDQGDTWTDTQISDTYWDGGSWGGGNEYIGVDVYHGFAVPVWSDKRSGNSTRIAYANPFEVPCPSTLNLTYGNYYITDEGSNFTYDAAYSASSSITVGSSTSAYKIYSGASVYMSAGSDITLNEGFECDGEFTADISSCNNFSQRVNNNDSTEVSDANNSLFTASDFPVRVFPNPTNGIMRTYVPIIDADDEGKIEIPTATISIYNAMGAEVYQSSVREWFTELNLSNQPTGLYLIKVTKGDKVYNGKIILQ